MEEGEDIQYLHSSLLREHASYPQKEVESEDYVDMGAAILDFYSSLVDLLASKIMQDHFSIRVYIFQYIFLSECAPDPLAIQAGKGESLRARAILRSLISLDDLQNILALRFKVPNLSHGSAATTDGRRHHPPNNKHHIASSNTFAEVALKLTLERDIDTDPESNYQSANSSPNPPRRRPLLRHEPTYNASVFSIQWNRRQSKRRRKSLCFIHSHSRDVVGVM